MKKIIAIILVITMLACNSVNAASFVQDKKVELKNEHMKDYNNSSVKWKFDEKSSVLSFSGCEKLEKVDVGQIKNQVRYIVSADDIKGKNALVLYSEATKSIPAQTTPVLVVVADEAQTTDEKADMSDLKIREISEKAGYTVKWTANDKPVEISKGKRTISVTAGESKAVVNNINMTLSEKVYIKDGVMYAPYDFADLLKR